MKQYFECHITIQDNPLRQNIQKTVEAARWKFSAIDGDPTLGKKVFCYATKHFPARFGRAKVLEQLTDTANLFRDAGMEVVREKIEFVLYDTKQGA